MNKRMYLEVREAIDRKNLEFVKTTIANFPPLDQLSNQVEKYWMLLIKGELLRFEKDFKGAKLVLEHALNILPDVFLTKIEISSIYGRYAFCLFQLKSSKEALPYYEEAKNLTKSDIRRNHFYSLMILKCLTELNEYETFLSEVKEIINTIVESSVSNLEHNIEFIGDIAYVVKQNQLFKEVEDYIRNLSLFNDTEIFQLLTNYLLVRFAHETNNYAKLVQTKNICINSIPQVLPVAQKLQILNNLALLFKVPFGDFSTASALLERALQLTDVNRPEWRVYILNSLGSIMRFKGNYRTAINFLNESIGICTKHDFFNPLGFAHNTLGMIYTLMGEYIKAKTHFKKSLDLNSKNNNLIGLGYTFGSIAWLESVQGNLLKANELYSKSISSFKVNSTPPSIILLTKADILSQLPSDQEFEIKELLAIAKNQIWKKKNLLDKGRYFISLGNINFNRNHLSQSEENFIKALEFTDSYEVKTQGLLGITKVRTELLFKTDETEHLLEVRERLRELKNIIQDKKSILGIEVEFISALLDMYEGDLQGAEEKISSLLLYTAQNSLTKLNSQIKKQLQTLSIYQKQLKIEKQVKGSHTYTDMKSQSLEDIIKYLKEMTNIFHSHDSKNIHEKD